MYMKINFKDSDDKLSCQIFVDDVFIGDVRLEISSLKWTLHPNFKTGYEYSHGVKDKYHSSYEAGKELAGLYKFFFPDHEEEQQRFGISLDEILAFLR